MNIMIRRLLGLRPRYASDPVRQTVGREPIFEQVVRDLGICPRERGAQDSTASLVHLASLARPLES